MTEPRDEARDGGLGVLAGVLQDHVSLNHGPLSCGLSCAHPVLEALAARGYRLAPEPAPDVTLDVTKATFPEGHAALQLWFELSYAQFLTVPRLVLGAMPDEWQGRLAALLEELDDTIDWRPKEGRYFVRLRDENGRFARAPLWNYRYGNVDDLRRLGR